MIQTKAFQILSTLNRDEFANFSRFIISPYFNRSKDLTKFFSAIKKYYPLFDSLNLEFEKIYKKLYPGKKFNEGTIRNLFSELGALLEKFLAYIHYETNFSFKFNLLAELNDRRLDKAFEKNYKSFLEDNRASKDTSGFKNLDIFHLQNEKKIYNLRRNKINNDDIINSGAESLLAFFLEIFLQMRAENSTIHRDYNVNRENSIVDKFFELTNIEELISDLKKFKSPYFKEIEFNFYLTLSQISPEGFKLYFDKTLELFKAYKKDISLQKSYNSYVSLINILNFNTRADDIQLKRIAFEIKKEMVTSGITSEMYGKLKTVEFANFMDSALTVGEIEWAKNFLKKKIALTDDEIKDDLFNYYKASILFFEKDYTSSNEYLSKVVKDSPYLRLDSRTLRMKNYYELNYFEAAFSQAESFKQLLIRNSSISPLRKTSYSNFLKFYFELIKIKSGMKQKNDLLESEIKACEKIRNKIWLMEKAHEILF